MNFLKNTNLKKKPSDYNLTLRYVPTTNKIIFEKLLPQNLREEQENDTEKLFAQFFLLASFGINQKIWKWLKIFF